MKIELQLKISFLVLISSLYFFGCGAPTNSSSTATISSVSCTTNPAPSYNAQAHVAFTNNCVTCHSNFNSYAGVRADGSNIEWKVESGEMPKTGNLSKFDKALILQWFACGMVQ